MIRVVIVGAGALGKCIAGLLADQASITIYEHHPRTRQALKKCNFVFKKVNRSREICVQSVSSLDKLHGQEIDVLIFTTKIMDLRTAVAEATELMPRFVFLPQNGIFDYQWIKQFLPRAQICRGVTTMACQKTGAGQVRMFFQGKMYLGGNGARFIADLFHKAGVGANVYRNPEGCVWAKLIFSSVMNPLSVITGQGYEVLRIDKDIWKLVKRAIIEGRAVAGAMGIRLSFDPMRLIDRVRNGDLAGIEHRGSIVHDLRAGRSTELDFITGALVRQARVKGIRTPALDFILSESVKVGA